MSANSKDGAYLTGLLRARRRKQGTAYLLVKSSPNSAAQVVFGDWLFDAAVGGAYTLICTNGTYSYTGQSATLLRSKFIIANSGSYTYTGQAANLYRNRALVASVGNYTYTGQAANIYRSRILVASFGGYSYSGQPATILRSRLITAGTGNYSYIGQQADLTYAGGSSLQIFTGISYIGGMTRHTTISRPAFVGETQVGHPVSGNLHTDTVQATSCLVNGEIP